MIWIAYILAAYAATVKVLQMSLTFWPTAARNRAVFSTLFYTLYNPLFYPLHDANLSDERRIEGEENYVLLEKLGLKKTWKNPA